MFRVRFQKSKDDYLKFYLKVIIFCKSISTVIYLRPIRHMKVSPTYTKVVIGDIGGNKMGIHKKKAVKRYV